jgi:hypothetical protein
VNLFKKGEFAGRTITPQIKANSTGNNLASTALEVTEELLEFMQVKCLQANTDEKRVEEFPEEIVDEYPDVFEDHALKTGGLQVG